MRHKGTNRSETPQAMQSQCPNLTVLQDPPVPVEPGDYTYKAERVAAAAAGQPGLRAAVFQIIRLPLIWEDDAVWEFKGREESGSFFGFLVIIGSAANRQAATARFDAKCYLQIV
jgi:hypothetical protein